MAVEAPPAPPPAATPAPAAPPAAPQREINVADIPRTHDPLSSAPRPGSAREKAFTKLREKTLEQAGKNPATKDYHQQAQPQQEQRPGAPDKPAEAPKPPEKPAEQPPEKPAEAPTKPAEASPPTKPEDRAKVSPWKLVDSYKAQNTKLQAEIAELRQTSANPEEVTRLTDRATKAEARVKELEDSMRFVDYQQSSEFKTKYQEPYQKQWDRTMGELAEFSVRDDSGNERPFTAQDMLQIVQMPVGQARKLCEELFGSGANDVMAHRLEIKRLFDQMNTALEDAKKNGGERIKQAGEQVKAANATIEKLVKDTWTAEMEAISNHETNKQWFNPREGDTEFNARLDKGDKLFVEAVNAAQNTSPKQTTEQRKAAIRKMAVVRCRNKAFGPLKLEVSRLQTKLQAAEKELAEYKKGEPPATGQEQRTTNGTETGTTRSRFFSTLHKNLVDKAR